MTHKFSLFLILTATIFLLPSCLNSDDDDDTTYYDDTSISSFTLGTLKVYHHTTKTDGVTDSTYTTSLTGSNYQFNIDQVAGTIYNNDSLPVGTDVEHVLATITTLNSGTAVLNLRSSSGTDSLAYYSSSDSIDFTNPVRVRVYNMRGTAYREYTITLNVHKEKADSFAWHSATVDGLEGITGRWLTINSDGTSCINGYDANGTFVSFQKTNDGWTKVDNPVESVQTFLAATYNNVYTLRNDSILRRNIIEGGPWTLETIDDSPTNLPNNDVNILVKASTVNIGAYNLALIGNRDGRTVVWSKVEESDNANNPWSYYTSDSYNRKTLPYLSNLRAVVYDNGILATGGDFTKMYFSQDWGLTWDVDSTYTLPSTFGYATSAFSFAVDTSNNIMYISKDGSGQIWSGRLARLGWKDEETVFTRSTK